MAQPTTRVDSFSYQQSWWFGDANYDMTEAVTITRHVVQSKSAVAIGNPKGFEFITSNGIISNFDLAWSLLQNVWF
jgi:hypothetical protein